MINFQSKHVALLKNKKDCADVYCVTLIYHTVGRPFSFLVDICPMLPDILSKTSR